jgi:hypothetical protein
MKKIYFFFAILLRVLLIIPIASSPLWYDENFTLLMIHRPLGQMFIAATGDVHPPMYYLLLWPLGQIPNVPVWIIRVPSLIFSIAALFVLWKILDRLALSIFTKRSAWVLYAVSSVALYYTQEGRMYSWMELLVLLAFLFLLDRRWILLSIVSVLLLWSHNYGFFYAVSFWIAGMVMDWRNWKALTITVGLAGLSFVPWVFTLASQIGTIKGTYWIFWQTWPSIASTFYNSFVLYGQTLVDILGMVIFFGWLTFSLLWMITHYRQLTKQTTILLIMAFAPFLMALIVSLTVQPILLYRALVPSAPFLTLILLLPLSESLYYSRGLKLAFILIIPFLVINPTRLYYSGYHLRGVNDREIIRILHTIETNWNPGDLIIHDGDGSIVDMLPYAIDPSTHYKLQPCGITRGSLSPLTRQGLGLQLIGPNALRGHVWLITEESPFTPACNSAWLDKVTHNIDPTYCIVDNYLQKSCLYELTFKN